MKTQLKQVLTLLLGLMTSVVIAGTNPEVSFVPAGHKSFALYLQSGSQATYSIRLADLDGSTLMTDRVKDTNAFARKYNLSNLPSGDYYVYVEESNKTVVQPITINGNAIEVDQAEQTLFFSPTVVVRNGRLDYTLLSLKQMPVSIRIIDELGRTNYCGAISETGSIQRRFDITALTPGTYRIITTVGAEECQKKYSEIFTVGETLAGN